MTKVPVLIAGIIVLVLCVRFVVQMLTSDTRVVTVDDFAKAREALNSIQIKTATIKRILSKDDLNFACRTGSQDLRRLFLKERKMLMVHWFRTIQQQVAYLMDIHLRLAACSNPSPESELKLTAQYATFILIVNCLIVLFWLFGPFKAQRTVAYIIHAMERFFGTFRVRLEGINPAQLSASRESLVH